MLLLSISPHQVVSELGIWLKLALTACCQDSYTLHKSGILTMLFFPWMLNILHVSMPYLTILLKFIKHLFTSLPSFNPSLNTSPSLRPSFHRPLPLSRAQQRQSQPTKAVCL